jgi:hypothetical protein
MGVKMGRNEIPVVQVCVELALLSSISTSDNLVRKIATVASDALQFEGVSSCCTCL